jgi:hypothetical protein
MQSLRRKEAFSARVSRKLGELRSLGFSVSAASLRLHKGQQQFFSLSSYLELSRAKIQ